MSGWGSASGGAVGGATTGAAIGGAIGSVVPGAGTLIGAGIGGALGAGAGFLAGGLSSLTADNIEKGKKWDDLEWYEKAAANLSASTEGIAEGVAGIVGLEDEVGHDAQDRLAQLKYKRSDDAAKSTLGGAISGASGGGEVLPMAGVGGGAQGASNEGTSLGRALAVEEEPALEDTNYNNNNFTF